MLAKDCILTRRAVRKFQKGKPISKEIIHELLNNAMFAPSAVNKQSWEFIVVNEESSVKQIANIHPYAKYILDSGFGIIVCGNTKECYPGFWPFDTGAATQNIMLTARYLGLGSVWCGVYPNEDLVKKIQEALKIPEHVIPMAVVVIGYPDEVPAQPTDRFKESKIHYNTYGKK